MRDSTKAIVFGLIYGKSVRTLSFDLSDGLIGAAKKAFQKAKAEYYALKESSAESEKILETKLQVKKAKRVWNELEEKPREVWVEETQVVFDGFLNKFSKMKDWLDWSVQCGRKHLYVYSPFGRRRNLYAHLTGIDALTAGMDRRAMNSPIQGMGADIGHTTNYLFHKHLYEILLHFGFIDQECRELPCGIETMVHDSIREEAPYELLLINAYVLQWVATVGVAEYYRDVFGVHMNIPPEIDMEIGCNDAILHKWDWSTDGQAGIRKVVKLALEDQVKAGRCLDAKAAYKKIFERKDILEYLQENYPTVGEFVPTKESRRSYISRKNFMEVPIV